MEIMEEYNFPQMREAETLSSRAKGERHRCVCILSVTDYNFHE